jgi:delta 1-pyrroline-5-carboxylate dehydrogenase
VRNPADHRDLVGHVREASIQDVDSALLCAISSGPIWQSTQPAERAAVLERAADLMEAELQQLMGLLVRESGKTFANAIAEVRERLASIGAEPMKSTTAETARFIREEYKRWAEVIKAAKLQTD